MTEKYNIKQFQWNTIVAAVKVFFICVVRSVGYGWAWEGGGMLLGLALMLMFNKKKDKYSTPVPIRCMT
jgi:hypothetical protein